MSNDYVDKVSAVGTIYDIHVPNGTIDRAMLDTDLQEKTDAVDDLKSALQHTDDYTKVSPVFDDSVLETGYYYKVTALNVALSSTKTADSGSVYTPNPIDVSKYKWGILRVRIGTIRTSGTRKWGFCNSEGIVTTEYSEGNSALYFTEENGENIGYFRIIDDYFYFSYTATAAAGFEFYAYVPKDDSIGYVATTGIDRQGLGTASRPFKTVNQALKSGYTTVLLAGGAYSQSIDLQYLKGNSFTMKPANIGERVIFVDPDSLIATSGTSVSGKVYSAPCSKTFGSGNIWIFQNNVDDVSTLIGSDERLPQQRGKTYRCSDTKIERLTTPANAAKAIEAIENTDGYTWWFDSGNSTIYFSRPDGLSSSKALYGSFSNGLFANANRKISLNLFGIETKYFVFNLDNTINSVVRDCVASNVFGAGAFTFNDAMGVTFERCEGSRAFNGTNGDGFNAHSTLTGTAFAFNTDATLIDCWAHDNRDDGISTHERSRFTVLGGLWEYNMYGAGITPSFGAECFVSDAYSRKNGDGGFLLFMNSTASTDPEDSNGTNAEFINCVAESNNLKGGTTFGYYARGANSRMACINCKSIDHDYGFYVDSGASDTVLIDCGALNCATPIRDTGNHVTTRNTTIVSKS